MKVLTGIAIAVLLLFILADRFKSMRPEIPPLTTLPPLTPEERRLQSRLRQHVTVLAGRIGPRNLWEYSKLQAAAGYIETELQRYGYRVRPVCYRVLDKPVCNLEVALPGREHPEEVVVIGAHYDTVLHSPGANDNGSGVAALLEIARTLRDFHPRRTLRLVAFVNEEAPFYRTGEMGSQVYARRARAHGDDIVAMLSLETIGYYSDAPGSQRFPNPVYAWFYPDTGNFVAFVSNLASWRLLRRCLHHFRRLSEFPAQGVAAPGSLTGIGWSDHASFWDQGYRALMITDTAPFRYPHYHRPSDTPDKLDYDAFARVVDGLISIVKSLSLPAF